MNENKSERNQTQNEILKEVKKSMWLNEKDRKYLNDVYARCYKKYFGWTASAPTGRPLSYAEAMNAARDELESFYNARRNEINTKHDVRVLAINTEANKRGLITSTIVLQQIERAEYERDLALSKFETVTEARVRAAARKIMADELGIARLSVQADRDALNMLLEKQNPAVFLLLTSKRLWTKKSMQNTCGFCWLSALMKHLHTLPTTRCFITTCRRFIFKSCNLKCNYADGKQKRRGEHVGRNFIACRKQRIIAGAFCSTFDLCFA